MVSNLVKGLLSGLLQRCWSVYGKGRNPLTKLLNERCYPPSELENTGLLKVIYLKVNQLI